MLLAAVVDIGMMLFSAVLNAGIHPVVTMIVVTGAIPVLAIATVSTIDGVNTRTLEPGHDRNELKHLASRLRP